MKIAVIIVAAGRGRRLGSDIPKQYLPIGDSCALRRSVNAFAMFPDVRWIVPVIGPDDHQLCADALNGLDLSALNAPVTGGDTRAASVRRGLESLQSAAPDVVLIHDAARPFVPSDVIRNVIAALQDHQGAFAALPVVDALWQSDGDLAQTAVSRHHLWRAQTPQGFRFDAILAAHLAHDGAGADDVAVAREAGLDVKIVLGAEQNYKITTAADLSRARRDAEITGRDDIEKM